MRSPINHDAPSLFILFEEGTAAFLAPGRSLWVGVIRLTLSDSYQRSSPRLSCEPLQNVYYLTMRSPAFDGFIAFGCLGLFIMKEGQYRFYAAGPAGRKATASISIFAFSSSPTTCT